MLCAKVGWNWPSGSREEVENVKSLLTDGLMDGLQTAGNQKSSGEQKKDSLEKLLLS